MELLGVIAPATGPLGPSTVSSMVLIITCSKTKPATFSGR
jgi:hypothetical protein